MFIFSVLLFAQLYAQARRLSNDTGDDTKIKKTASGN
jgi:hypothetical protein